MLWHLGLLLQRPGDRDLLCWSRHPRRSHRAGAVHRLRLLRGDRAHFHPAGPAKGLGGLHSRSLARVEHPLTRELVEPPAPVFAPSSRLIRS